MVSSHHLSVLTSFLFCVTRNNSNLERGFEDDDDYGDVPPSALPYPMTPPVPPSNLLFGTNLAEPGDLNVPYQDLFNANAYVS